MSERIAADQFEVYRNFWIPGKRVLEEFKFDEQRCVIGVDEEGALSITQEGKNSSYFVGSKQWRRVPVK
jgi:hypothetical protein